MENSDIMDKNDNINLRSPKMRETIGRPPHWFVRYGTVIVALALLALGAVGYYLYVEL